MNDTPSTGSEKASLIPTREELEHLERDVESAMQRMDAVFVSQIEQDYSNAEQDQDITIRFEPASVNSESQEQGGGTHSAAYHTEKNTLVLPTNTAPAEYLPHEVWHSFFDDQGERGMFYDEAYAGPSLEDIQSFVIELGKRQDVLQVRERTEKQIMTEFLAVFIQEFLPLFKYMGALMQQQGIIEQLQGKLEPDAFKSFAENVSSAQEILKIIQDKEGLLTRPGLETIELLNQKFRALVRAVATLSSVSEGDMIRDDIHLIDQLIIQPIGADAKKEQQAALQNPDHEAERVSKLTNEFIQLTNIARFLVDHKPEDLTSRDTLAQALRRQTGAQDYVHEMHEWSSLKHMGSVDETMARVVDALYNLHFGPVEQNRFPLSETELSFLETMKYNGTPIFRKGVEKYRVGLKMLAEGGDWTPDSVRAELLDKTSYTYQGVDYDWSNADFTIQGDIPVEDLSVKLKIE